MQGIHGRVLERHNGKAVWLQLEACAGRHGGPDSSPRRKMVVQVRRGRGRGPLVTIAAPPLATQRAGPLSAQTPPLLLL